MAANPRVHEIASQHGAPTKQALNILKQMGEYVKGPSSSIQPQVARRLGAALARAGYEPAPGTKLGQWTVIPSAEPGLLVGAPRTLPRLVDVLAGTPGFPTGARNGDHIFYMPPEPARALADQRGANSPGFPIAALPSPAGVAVLPRSDRTANILCWAETPGALTATVFTVEVTPDGKLTAGLHVRTDVAIIGETIPAAGAPFGFLEAFTTAIPVTEDSNDADAGEPSPGAGGRRTPDPNPDGIRIVYLTRRPHNGHRSENPDHRDNRWTVRGHYRQQWYPSTGEHKRLWIREHEAGNMDAPLNRRRIVNVVKPNI